MKDTNHNKFLGFLTQSSSSLFPVLSLPPSRSGAPRVDFVLDPEHGGLDSEDLIRNSDSSDVLSRFESQSSISSGLICDLWGRSRLCYCFTICLGAMAAEASECNGVVFEGDLKEQEGCRAGIGCGRSGEEVNGDVKDEGDGSYVFVDGGESDEAVEGDVHVVDPVVEGNGIKSVTGEYDAFPENAGQPMDVVVSRDAEESGMEEQVVVELPDSSSLEVVDGKEDTEPGVSGVVDDCPGSEMTVETEIHAESCPEKVGDGALSVEDGGRDHEESTGTESGFEIVDGGEEEGCVNKVEEQPVTELVVEMEASDLHEETCENEGSSKDDGHDQEETSTEVTANITSEQQTDRDLVDPVPAEAEGKQVSCIAVDEGKEEVDDSSKVEEQSVSELVVEVTEAPELHDETCNGGSSIGEYHDQDQSSIEVSADIMEEEHANAGLVQVPVEEEGSQGLDLVTEVAKSESWALESEKEASNTMDESPIAETSRNVRLDLEVKSHEESETRTAIADHSETVPIHANNVAESEVEIINAPPSLVSDAIYEHNVALIGSSSANFTDDIEPEYQVPCSIDNPELQQNACNGSDENVLSCSSENLGLENNTENVPIEGNASADNDSIDGKELELEVEPESIDRNIEACVADRLDSENKVGCVSRGDDIPDTSCTVKDDDLESRTANVSVQYQESVVTFGEVEISLADIRTTEPPPPDGVQEVDIQDVVEISKGPAVEGSTQGDHENGILSSTPVDASNLSPEAQNVDAELKRLPCYMIRVPKFHNDKLMAQKLALEQQVEEKTRSRDSLKMEMQNKKVARDETRRKLDSSRKEENAARDAFNAKRQEIDSIQLTINRMKNATSIDDIDDRIHNLEHRIQHETISLKEEKQLIREIKSFRQNRERLSSSLGPQAEVQEAFDQKDQIEEHFERLRKDLNSLKSEMSRAEVNTKAIKKVYDDECQAIRDLIAQYKAADDLRQEAYARLWNVKKELHEKNIQFYHYKDDRRAAENHVSSGNREALRCHCTDQVEKIMELWNRNDDFRKQYVKFNTMSTVRRFKTLDARSLGPDEEPAVIPNPRGDWLSTANLAPSKSESAVSSETKQERPREPAVPEKADLQPSSKATERNRSDKSKKSSKPTAGDTIVITVPSEAALEAEKEKKRTEDKLTRKAEELRKEEELARKEEVLRKEKADAELKEKNRLEQIAKAREAEERKRRKAEKAKAKAEIRARKEAELKEKKKAKKGSQKEKKAASTIDAANGGSEAESLPGSGTPLPETVEEPEAKTATVSKRPSRTVTAAKQQNKINPLPLPLRNRGKRKMQTWMSVLLTAVVVLLLFLVGNYVSFSKFSLPNVGH